MVTVLCRGACAELCSARELLTAGMANAVTVRLEFSGEWETLQKTAVFTNGNNTIAILKTQWDGNTVRVPPEMTREAGRNVHIGVYGTDGENVILPTIWADLGPVLPAASPIDDITTDPTLPVWQQIQNQIGDLEDLQTLAKDCLVAAINEARQSGGGGGSGGGTTYIIGDGLKLDQGTNTLSVDAANVVEQDNTKPVTSAAVYTEVGNINALLATI